MKRLLILLIGVWIAHSSFAAPADVVLLAADDALLRPFREKLVDPQHEAHGAWELWSGRLGNKSVVLGRTEGDPLNAVAVTTLAVRLHTPRLLVIVGRSRALDPTLQSGDIVVSDRFAAMDGMVSRTTPLEGGVAPLTWKVLPHLMMTSGEREIPTKSFPADKAAVDLALSLKPGQGHVLRGVLGSANQSNGEADRVAWLRQHWGVTTEDGESGHVAGCALLFGVPVVGLRIIGDGDISAFALQFLENWR